MQRTMEHWEQVAVKDSEGRWEALGENGWFTMLAWAAGPDNVRKTLHSDAGRTVRQTLVADGLETRSFEPFTEEDRAAVEESINSYIGTAGMPPRPPGFAWHLRVPAGWAGERSVADELSAQILREQRDEPVPAELWPLIVRIVTAFYSENGS